jgi:uncharacterized membrane protein YfcA
MTPLLVLLFGVNPISAVGTDLLNACLTKSAGSVVHARSGTVKWAIAAWLMAGSIPAALLSVVLIRWLDLPDKAFGTFVSRTLGICLVLTAIVTLLRNRILAMAEAERIRVSPRNQRVATVVIGAMLGVLVTITSVGAGALGVTALILLYPRIPVASIVGTDIVHAVPLTLVAGLAHASTGTVRWDILAWLLLGSFPGIVVGSYLAPRVNEATLRTILAAVLVVAGGRLAFV